MIQERIIKTPFRNKHMFSSWGLNPAYPAVRNIQTSTNYIQSSKAALKQTTNKFSAKKSKSRMFKRKEVSLCFIIIIHNLLHISSSHASFVVCLLMLSEWCPCCRILGRLSLHQVAMKKVMAMHWGEPGADTTTDMGQKGHGFHTKNSHIM